MKFVFDTCDIFPGFYESWIYNGDSLLNFDRDDLPKEFNWEFKEGGFLAFQKATAKKWLDSVESNLDSDIVKVGDFIKLWSPTYYNYTTDSIFFNVEVDLRALKKYCWITYQDEFTKHLERWSSQIHYLWKGDLSLFQSNYREHLRLRNEYVNVMTSFYLEREVNWDNVYYDVMDSQWEILSQCVVLEKSDGTLWDYEWDNGYKPTKQIS